MDAAIAGLFCNGVYTAFSMGVGGGHLMTIYIKETGEVTTLTAREMAPGYVTQDMFDDNPMGAQEGEETKRRRQSRTALKNFPFLFGSGPLAMGIPGEIKGYWEAKQRYGNPSITWASLIQPTIDMCRNGITVSFSMWEALTSKSDEIKNDVGLRY